MNDRLNTALLSIIGGSSTIKAPKKPRRRPLDKELENNTTIKFFRDISKRRVRSSPVPSALATDFLFKPFDRDALLLRISTFQKVANWNIRHCELTPLSAALCGWECNLKKLNTLRCSLCHAVVTVMLPDITYTEDGEEAEEQLELIDKVIQKYVAGLKDFHKGKCLWKKQGTPLSVYEISFANMDNAVHVFTDVYSHNLQYLDELQDLKIESVLSDDQLEVLGLWLQQHDLQPDSKLIELSVLGWEVHPSGANILLISKSDARRVLISGADGEINLLKEHHDWSCFVKGYHILIDILSAMVVRPKVVSSIVPSTPEQDPEGTHEIESSVLVSDEPHDGTSESSSSTRERLERLRKVYFS